MKPLRLKNKINFFIWRKIHTLPRFAIEWWQLYQLKRTVCQAFNVPIYIKFYKEAGVKPENIWEIDDIQKLPISQKRIFQLAPPNEIVNKTFPREAYVWDGTSGSTGEPFRFPKSRRGGYTVRVFERRPQTHPGVFADKFLWWLGYSPSYIHENIRLAKFRQMPKPRGKSCLSINLPALRENPQKVVEDVRNFKPDLVEGRATVLAEFARLCELLPKHLRPSPRFALTAGEILTSGSRAYIQNVLGAEVYDLYGLQETSDIGCECRKHDGFHIYEESVFVEILNNNGEPMPPNTIGRIVVTHFLNDVLPFIRYDTGDLGMIRHNPCPCGLPNPRLYVDGRIGGFVTIGGKKYHSHELEFTIRTLFTDTILRYQFVKISENDLELRLIPTKSYSVEATHHIQKTFLEMFDFKPTVKVVDSIPYTKEGKTLTIVDETENASHVHQV